MSLTNNAVKELNKLYSDININQKITVIPCCTNTDLFNKQTIQHPLNIPSLSTSDHVLIYTGSIGTWYYTKEMIDCILEWKKNIPNIKLLIVTKDTDALAAILNNYPIEVKNTIITLSSSYQNIPNYLNTAKAAIFFIKPSYSKIASSPTKMAECWAMNLPIITNSCIGDNDVYFKNNQGGILIDNFTIANYKKANETYIKLLEQKNNYRDIALTHFNLQNAIKKYTSIYKSQIQ